MLKGKLVSILGDSLSTYKGVSNDASHSESTKWNPWFYDEPFPLRKTYWMRLIEGFEMQLCVNNSWSGGNLSGASDESAGINRAKYLSRDSGECPDLIIVFIGTNDLGRGIDAAIFANDYEKTLKIIKESYPTAKVCCVNLPDRDIFKKKRAEIFNEAIAGAIQKAGDNFFLADLFNSRLNNDFYYMNTVDSLHLDEDGHRHLAEIIESAIKAFYLGS